MIDNGLTPPDTVLPDLANQLFGDRDEFYGFPHPSPSIADFHQRHHAAASRDTADWNTHLGPLTISNAPHYSAQLTRPLQNHRSHLSRFFDTYPVEFAFLTNDTVWWIATRQPDAIDALHSYASTIQGMSFRETPAFGL